MNLDSVAVEWDLFTDISRINAWLDNNPQSPHEDAMRVMKVGEEYGEAVAAYIGMTGQNPRKGITHSQSDLLAELADVAITALCAIQHFTGNTAVTRAHLASKVTSIITRANIPAEPKPEPWECPRCRCLFERAGMGHEPCRTLDSPPRRVRQVEPGPAGWELPR